MTKRQTMTKKIAGKLAIHHPTMNAFRPTIADAHPFTLRTVSIWLLGVLILLALMVYIGYQARFLLIGPEVLVEPSAETTVSERTVTIAGTARNIARISLNGRQIFTDPDGEFAELVVLNEGYNLITVAATDRYGRTTAVEQEYVYQPNL